nr:hypothetical protein [Tanacetum cinerariifolium]
MESHDYLGCLVSMVDALADCVDTVDLRGPSRSSGVNVSTLSRLIRKLEKPKGVSMSLLKGSECHLASRGRLSTVECFCGQPAQSYSKHDLEMVVFVVEKTIQDAERIVQLVDLQHLCQTPDVRDFPSKRRTIQDAGMFEQLVDHWHLFQTPDVEVPPSNRFRCSSDHWIELFPSIFSIWIFFNSISDKSAAIAYEVLDEWDDRVRTSALSVAFIDSSIRDLNLSSKRNAELNVGRFSRIMLGIVGGGIGASPVVVIVAMVEGVIIGVGVLRDTIREDVVVKIDSTPTSLIGFNMLDTNDDIDELSCGPSGLTGVRVT